MNKAVLLGIDVGSTSIRCCAYDIKTNLIKQASRPTRLINTNNENQEDTTRSWNAELLWKLVYEVVLEVSSYLAEHQYSPLGIATSSVGCSPVILDKLGNLLYPITRHHGSGSNLLQKYLLEFGEYKFQKKTGYPLAHTTTGFLLARLKETDLETYSQIVSVLPISNYIAYKLTGEQTTDRSIAASFGLWDHDTNTWWTEILSDLGLGSDNFGKVIDGGEFIGKITPRISEVTGLPIDLPVYSGGHDYLCAALAAGCFKPGQIFNIEGTFEIATTFHLSPILRSLTDQTRAITDMHVVPHVYSLMVERIGAGQIEWLKNLLYPLHENTTTDWDTVFNEINEIPDCAAQDEFFIPYVYGMLFPELKDDLRGGVLGLKNTSTRSSIMRSAIFSHCFESRRMIDFQKGWNAGDVNQVVTVGGITRSSFWMQQKANLIGLKIIVPNIEEPSALGAALLAGIGSGIYKDFETINELLNTKEAEIYVPNKSRADYFADYYQRVYLPVMKQVGVIEEVKESGKKELLMTTGSSKNIKIGVIGGGSVFTPELIQLLGKNTEVTGPIDVCLMDILPERLQIVGEMCQRLIEKTKEPVTITMVTDSAEAIKGSDFVCNQFRAGGLPARIEDEKLGRKYKLPFTETVSVCGFATYLRSFPEVGKLAEQILKYSPDAWVLNFANPAGMLSETFYRFGIKNVIGVCNVSEKLKDFIAERLHVSRSDIFMNWRGLNHMTFVDKVYVHGQDLFDEVVNRYEMGENKLPFPKELIQNLSLLPNQYLQYYYLKDEIIAKLQKQERNRSEFVLELEKELLTLFTTIDEIPDQLKQRGGFGYSRVVAGLIRDMIVDGGNVHYGIVRNGTTLKEIPENGFVEVPILAHKNRIETLQVDPLPTVVTPLVVSLKAYEDMLIDASFNKDKNQLLKSLVMHPLIPTYDIAKSLLEDVMNVNNAYMSWFNS